MAVSHTFITAIAEQRDRLYRAALASVLADGPLSPPAAAAKAEVALLKATRAAFASYAQAPMPDPLNAITLLLPAPADAQANAADAAMPADLWARLTAAVQVDAAKSLGSKAINPDSVLLSPDPLLAPKKSASPDDDGFDLSPPSRFFITTAIAICIGIILTIYIASHSGGPATPVTYPVPHTPSTPDAPTPPPTSQPTTR